MEMSDVEIVQLDKYIENFERRVNNWQRDRIFYLIVGLIILCIGAIWMINDMRSLLGTFSPISELKLSERPEDISLELWAVAEIRKTARILELRYNVLGLALIGATVGLLTICLSILLLVPLIRRWRDGGKEMVFTRILCAQWKMLREEN